MRSSEAGPIGFLSVSNRVCVALSRARWGMFIIGNLALLERRTALWEDIGAHLRREGAAGPALTLECQNHPGKRTAVACEADFAAVPDGGCDAPCLATLDCGHACPRRCHPYPHSEVLCFLACERVYECGHKCKKRCHEPCGACPEAVVRALDCGHSARMVCSQVSSVCPLSALSALSPSLSLSPPLRPLILALRIHTHLSAACPAFVFCAAGVRV